MTASNQTTPQLLLPLPFDAWKDTLATVHMWTQIVGKLRMNLTPLVNHWWNVPLYLTPRGLTTSAMPWQNRTLEVRFDFIAHKLVIEVSDGRAASLALQPQTVAAFYESLMAELGKMGIEVKIRTTPCEVPDPIPFE